MDRLSSQAPHYHLDEQALDAYGSSLLRKLADYMNPRHKDLSLECPKLNASPLFGSDKYIKIGYPDVHPSVSLWGSDTYLTGWVVIGEESAIYPGCNFNADALMPLIIGKRCSLQHVELHYSGFRMLPTVIGDDTFMSHLSFGHSVRIGQRCYILGHATFFDGAEVGDDCFIDGNATILGSARLLSGWAYAGVVDRNTPPMCRTSEVVFGIDPKTGETLYIGGPSGVADTVNRSHLLRNKRHMQLVATRLGLPEYQRPAHAVTMPHVFQTGEYYLALAASILDTTSRAATPGYDQTLAADLVAHCRCLCRCIRAIFEGAPIDASLEHVWLQRSPTIGQTINLIDRLKEPVLLSYPAIPDRLVIHEASDREILTRWLRDFDALMHQAELKLGSA